MFVAVVVVLFVCVLVVSVGLGGGCWSLLLVVVLVVAVSVWLWWSGCCGGCDHVGRFCVCLVFIWAVLVVVVCALHDVL